MLRCGGARGARVCTALRSVSGTAYVPVSGATLSAALPQLRSLPEWGNFEAAYAQQKLPAAASALERCVDIVEHATGPVSSVTLAARQR